MVPRTVLFLDYQNVYMGARESFHVPSDPSQRGQIDPIRLGESIVARDKFQRELTQVRIYRGLSGFHKDSKGHRACSRQISARESDPRVHVVARPLLYRRDSPPQEKGIDVALALDFLAMGMRDEYDVGIMFSTDTDLKPALEVVTELAGDSGRPRAEVANWSGGKRKYKPRLSVGRNPYERGRR